MTSLFTLVGEFLLRGTDEAKRDIQDLTSTSEKSSSKIEQHLKKVGQSIEENFKSEEPKKVKTALEKLNYTVKSQKKRLDELKSKYQNLYITQGKNSDEAKKTAKEIEELSKELNNNERELKEAKQASDKFGDSLENLEKNANKTESKLATMSKKVAKILATAFAVDKIKDFGVAITKASAEVSAEMSAFKQIMGDYSDTAQIKMNEVAENTGVVSTRLTPYMTSLTAKFKGLGNDIATATDLATRGLTLATDASAFWDKSLEDSMSALNSFINGSYEGGEAIGLFANDTQLAQYAIQQGVVKSTKDWSALDEATKQATRLEYAEAMMFQSGAMGQAKNESGQYANVMANLTETWRQFQAEIGKPLIQNVVIPTMEGLQTIIGTLSDKYKQFSQWISDNKEAINKWVDVIIIAGTIVGIFAVTIGTLQIITNISKWISIASTAISGFWTLLSGNPIAIVVTAIAGLIIAFIKAYNESETFRNKVDEVVNAVTGFFSNAWDTIKLVWDAVKPYFDQIWEGIKTTFSVVESVLSGFFTLAWESIKIVWDLVESYFNTLWEAIKGIFSVVESVLSGDFEGAWNAIKKIWDSVEGYFNDVWEAIKKIFQVVDGVLGGFFSDAWTSIKKVFSNPTEFFSGVWNDILTAFRIDDIVEIGKNLVEGLWNGINNTTDWIVEKVKGFGNSVLSGIKDFFGIKSPSKIFAEIGKFLVEGLGIGIENNADYAIDAVEELGEETTSGFQGIMDKLYDWFSSNPVLRRIGEAFGFKFADAVESTEEVLEETGKKAGETVAKGMEQGFNANLPKVSEVVESWGDKVLRLTENTAEGQKVALENELKELKKLYGDGIGTGKDLNSSYMVMLSQQIAETEKSLSKFEAKEKTLASKIKDFFSGTFEEISSKINNLLTQTYNYIEGFISSIESYQQQILQNEITTYESRLEELRRFNEEKLSEEEKEVDEQKELLKSQLYSGKINYSEYVSSIKNLDKELEKSKKEKAKAEEKVEKDLQTKKDELGRKAFEANKRTEIANVWINTASAILKSYAQMGWVAGSVASSLLLATAGVQTATINQQQYTPALAEGGIIDRPTTALIGEDGKEAVVPLERNLEWVGGLASALQPVMTEARYDYKPCIEEVRDVIQEFKESVIEMFEELLSRESTITLDGRIVAHSLLPHINRELGNVSKLKARGI